MNDYIVDKIKQNPQYLALRKKTQSFGLYFDINAAISVFRLYFTDRI